MSVALDAAAVGLMVNAGPPLYQLGLEGDDWLLHCEVVRRAEVMRKQVIEWLTQSFASGTGLQFFPVPPADVSEEA